MKRRNIHMPDDLWRRLTIAALEESQRQGRAVSISEVIRSICEAAMQPEEQGEARSYRRGG